MHVVGLAMLATNVCYLGGVELTTFAGWPPIAVPLLLALSEGLVALALCHRAVLRSAVDLVLEVAAVALESLARRHGIPSASTSPS